MALKIVYELLSVFDETAHGDDLLSQIWSKREVEAKDYEIARISAKDLSIELFQQNYMDKNIPVIITHLDLWNNKCNSDIDGINECLDSNYLLKNVFITTNNQNRFLYFDKDNDNKEDNNDNKSQIRTAMKWTEFRQRILSINNDNNSPYLDEKEHYYLYGEKLPKTLLKFINIPSFFANKNELDEILIWISSNGTCSPLHFDLCQTFLCQLSGIKRVCLFKFSSDKYANFYPFPFNSKYNRQSMINDIHAPDVNRFKLFAKDNEINCYQGIMNKNEGLYIPFSWWHQIESDNEVGSISLAFRCNPYLDVVRNAILMSSKIKNKFISDIIFNEFIEKTPFYIKNVAKIWKEIFNANANIVKENNNSNGYDDKQQILSNQSNVQNDIDLFDVD